LRLLLLPLRRLLHQTRKRTPLLLLNRSLQRLPLPRMPRCIAPWATPTLLRPQPPCRRAAWSCPKPDLARFTRRPRWFPSCTLRRPATWLAAFSAASPSLIAAPRALRAATFSAPPAAHQGSILAAPVRVPSILPAPAPALTLAPERPEHVPALAHALALDHPAPAARLVRVALRPPAKRRVRSVHQRAAVVDVPSTPRRRKAQ
jgi:hypothetical protein